MEISHPKTPYADLESQCIEGLRVEISHPKTPYVDLESQCIEGLCVEISHPKTPSLLVRYVYRDPSATYELYDEFVAMLDKVAESKNVFPLRDFNIDLFKPHFAWESTFSIFGLDQSIAQPKQVNCSTKTLIDDI